MAVFEELNALLVDSDNSLGGRCDGVVEWWRTGGQDFDRFHGPELI
jgi:hypothetical protein